jgi:hypothetical protein
MLLDEFLVELIRTSAAHEGLSVPAYAARVALAWSGPAKDRARFLRLAVKAAVETTPWSVRREPA